MATPLSDRLAELRARGEGALVLFVTAGDQPLEELPAILDALCEGGADVVEVGIPFSDPFGEGPTIQASSQRALSRGVTPRSILAKVGECRVSAPIVTMGYTNPVLRFGLEDFAKASRDAGVSGTILSDLVPDEADAWGEACAAAGLDTIFLAAPTSTPARLAQAASRSTGFVYAVSRTGVTGAEHEASSDVAPLVRRLRGLTPKPICVGFGISRPEHVRRVCEVADGAVVGSFLVDLLAREWHGGAGRARIVDAVRALKASTRKGEPAGSAPGS